MESTGDFITKRLKVDAAGSAHGPWQPSRSPALNFALPHACFRSPGLPSLTVNASAQPAEACGPARTVV